MWKLRHPTVQHVCARRLLRHLHHMHTLYLAIMAWMCRTVWCMLSCALTRLPLWSRICSVVEGCEASTSGASEASGAPVAVITAPSATADALVHTHT